MKHASKPRSKPTTMERFFNKVQRMPEGCWQWVGDATGTEANRYGRFYIDPSKRRRDMAHRVSYEMLVGPIPEGLTIDHLCRNGLCVNPDHMEPVTGRENTLRGIGRSAVNARKTHCIHGHPFDAANTYVKPTGQRQCIQCHKDYAKRVRHRRSR